MAISIIYMFCLAGTLNAQTYQVFAGWHGYYLNCAPSLSLIKSVLKPDGIYQYSGDSWVSLAGSAESKSYGTTYFLKYNTQKTITSTICPNGSDPNQPYTFPLAAGWNLIGVPFNASVNITNDNLDICGTPINNSNAIQRGFVAADKKSYEIALPGQSIQPRRPYWAFAYQPCDLTIHYRPPSPPPAPGNAPFLPFIPSGNTSEWKYWTQDYMDGAITQPRESQAITADTPTTYPDDYDRYYSSGAQTLYTTTPVAKFTADTAESSAHPGRRGAGNAYIGSSADGFTNYVESATGEFLINKQCSKIIPANISVNYEWDCGYSSSGNIVMGKIISANESVHALAGAFTGCLKIYYLEQNQNRNIYYHDEYDWYCPAVGLVKSVLYIDTITHKYNEITELQNYSIH